MNVEEEKYFFLEYNLQWFAKDGEGGEKTEPATAKKLRDAREEGQVAKSKELSAAVDLIALFLVLKIFISYIGENLISMFPVIYKKMPDIINDSAGGMSIFSATTVVNNVMLVILKIVAPVFVVGVLVCILINIFQVGWKITTKPMRPKASKINPLSGFKRIFSKDSLFELVKSIAKIALIAYVAYTAIKGHQNELFLLYDIPLMQVIILVGSIVIDAGFKISLVYLVVGIADWFYQKHKFKEDMKMTKQEVKDEYKNTEGNPEIKGRQRSKMREASQRRMMQNLPTADVVITNPTHLSVAIKYDADKNSAPVVIAKGEDYLAMKIREIARENNIEIVENKPLARMLYANVEVGAEVPPELYQAVAEVLAFVYSLKNK
ncbi:flagellar biosynthesis protein FlhB [Roseburia sp. 499]|nr:flagellar biosynthesis protein FlhB [Roseburia sp. 499]WVK71589.1 flagellar biosynthesis protein FlhB [Roseburia sp. 499]